MNVLITYFELARSAGMVFGGVIGIGFAGASLGVLAFWLLRAIVTVLRLTFALARKGGA